jgi:hypothetical protein
MRDRLRASFLVVPRSGDYCTQTSASVQAMRGGVDKIEKCPDQ